MHVDGGVAREIGSSREGVVIFQGWSPDASDILYTVAPRSGGAHQLWRAPLAGGTPECLGVDIPGATQINPVAIDPTGSEIAYTAGTPANEIWMMENFLPR